MKIEHNGVSVELNFDSDGFPLVVIDTGGGYYDENERPTVGVVLNDETIHEMFDHSETE